MPTNEPITVDPASASSFASGADALAESAKDISKPGPDTGLDDIDEALGRHKDKTRKHVDDAAGTLKKTSFGVKDVAEGDKESARGFKTPTGGQPAPAPQAQQIPQPAGAPQAQQTPQPAGAPQAQQTPQPAGAPQAQQTPQPAGAGMRPIAPSALAALLSRAGVTPESVERGEDGKPRPSALRAGGGKQPLTSARIAKTGARQLTPAALEELIDQALDLNGVPRDKLVRAKWQALDSFIAFHESSNDPDRTQGIRDVNWSGEICPGDNAPAHAARGLMQVVPDTFKAYHVAGTSDNIYDPLANLAASQRYRIEHYGLELEAGPKFDRFVAARHSGGYTGY